MAVNLRPMSFHCSSTACVGLTAGLGASFFFAASCATAGSTTNPMANANPAIHLSFFIFSLLRYAPHPVGAFFPSDARLRQTFPQSSLLVQSHLAFRGGLSYAVKTPSSCKIHWPRMLNLCFKLGGAITVNWNFLLLRIAIALSILTMLYLSQRFWSRALWRVTSHWGRLPLRVAVRLAYVVLLLLVIFTMSRA